MNIAEALDAQLNVFNTFGWSGEMTVCFCVDEYTIPEPCYACSGDFVCPECNGEGETYKNVTEEYVETYINDNVFDIFKVKGVKL